MRENPIQSMKPIYDVKLQKNKFLSYTNNPDTLWKM